MASIQQAAQQRVATANQAFGPAPTPIKTTLPRNGGSERNKSTPNSKGKVNQGVYTPETKGSGKTSERLGPSPNNPVKTGTNRSRRPGEQLV